MFGNKRERNEEAAGLYKEAAQQYKIAGNSNRSFQADDKAVEAYTQAARLYEGLEDMQETADCYSNIGDLEFKASSVTKACEALKNSAQIYLKQGKPGDVGLE